MTCRHFCATRKMTGDRSQFSSVVEQRFCKPSVVGSNPTTGSIFSPSACCLEGLMSFIPMRSRCRGVPAPGVWRCTPSSTLFTSANHRQAIVRVENSSASPQVMRASGGSNRLRRAHFPCATRPKPLHACHVALLFSRNVFSRISSTALSRGRAAARLLAMMSARAATHKSCLPSLIVSALERRLLNDFTP